MLPNDQRMDYRHLRRRARKCVCPLSCLLIAAVLVGCSQLPSAPSAPSISARGASSEAMTLYDANQDGKIDADEMKAPGCPLAAAIKTIDANRDGAVTRDEIKDRIRKWQASTSRLMMITPRFYFDQKPLVGATVTFEAAEFLGIPDVSYTAVTDADGAAKFSGTDRQYPGIYLGLYRVRVSKKDHGKELIPAKYNTNTVLAHEVASDPWVPSFFKGFDLRSK